MSFDTWYDLEEGFDFVYLMAREEGGPWQFISSNACRVDAQNGIIQECGYTGATSGWQTQVVDLSAFAGKKITLQFEYISDGGISKNGFAVDNLSIPQIGYLEDFENGDGGWIGSGFSRIQNALPQTFLVTLITDNQSDPITKYTLHAGEDLDILLDPYCMDDNPILIVSGASQDTRQLAHYTITLTE
jgi:immune inhibitor A